MTMVLIGASVGCLIGWLARVAVEDFNARLAEDEAFEERSRLLDRHDTP